MPGRKKSYLNHQAVFGQLSYKLPKNKLGVEIRRKFAATRKAQLLRLEGAS